MSEEREEQTEEIDDTRTGGGEGVSAMGGVPAGGGALAGQTDGTGSDIHPIGGRDTDTGMQFGPGQSTTTGTLPHQGGPNLDGTGEGGTVGTDAAGGDNPPRASGVGDTYNDPRDEADRRERHDGFDRTDISDERNEDSRDSHVPTPNEGPPKTDANR